MTEENQCRKMLSVLRIANHNVSSIRARLIFCIKLKTHRNRKDTTAMTWRKRYAANQSKAQKKKRRLAIEKIKLFFPRFLKMFDVVDYSTY